MEIEKAARIVKKAIADVMDLPELVIADTDLLEGKLGIDEVTMADLIEHMVVGARDAGHDGFEFDDDHFFDDYDLKTVTVGDMTQALSLMLGRPKYSVPQAPVPQARAA